VVVDAYAEAIWRRLSMSKTMLCADCEKEKPGDPCPTCKLCVECCKCKCRSHDEEVQIAKQDPYLDMAKMIPID
jgi:hypothetical protein